MTSVWLFGVAALVLLAAPLVVLLVWALVREQHRRAELREQVLQGPIRARDTTTHQPRDAPTGGPTNRDRPSD